MNYKISTIVLAFILVITWIFYFGAFFEKNEMGMSSQKIMSGMHQMSDGSVMDNHSAMDMKNMMMDMTSRMNGKKGAELEKVFLEDMIVHHEGAIQMAQKLKEGTTRAELTEMADDIVSTQTKEVEMMKRWLGEWFE